MVSSASEKPVSQGENTAGVPLCVDCKWYKRIWFPTPWDPHQFAECRRPSGAVRMTDGKILWLQAYAEIERKYGGLKRCGPDARHYLPRREVGTPR